MSRLLAALTLSILVHGALLMLPVREQTAGPSPHLTVTVEMPALAGEITGREPSQRDQALSPPSPQPQTTKGQAAAASTDNTPPASAAQRSTDSSPTRTSGKTAQDQQQIRWLTRVREHLASISEYPPRARLLGQEGMVVLSFRVSASGAVSDAGISQSSQFRLLDQSALALLEGQALPPPPDSLAGTTVRVPVRYQLDASSGAMSTPH